MHARDIKEFYSVQHGLVIKGTHAKSRRDRENLKAPENHPNARPWEIEN